MGRGRLKRFFNYQSMKSKWINSLIRKLLIILLFGMLLHSSAFASPGLLNSSYEEVAGVLGKPFSHENSQVSGIQYDRYHFERHNWKTAVLFIAGRAQKLDTEKSDGSQFSVEDKAAIFEVYDAAGTGQNSKVRGWHQLNENHFIREDGRVHVITHLTSMTVFLDDLPRDFW